MTIIEQSREFMPIGIDPFERMELIGKVYTKKEDNIKEGSAIRFFKNHMIDGHTAIAAHGVLYYEISDMNTHDILVNELDMFMNIRYSITMVDDIYYIAINYRSIIDIISAFNINEMPINGANDILKYIINDSGILDILHDSGPKVECVSDCTYADIHAVSEEYIIKHAPDIYHLSIKFITDRGVSHEMVRHTAMAFMQESTRWCNYGKKGIVYIRPYWMSDKDFNHIRNNNVIRKETGMSVFNPDLKDHISSSAFARYRTCCNCEKMYNIVLMEQGSAQAARGELPNCVKTEIWITAPLHEWIGYKVEAENYIINELKGFIPQRTSKVAHPDMLVACNMIKESIYEFIHNNNIDEDSK